MLLTDIKGNSLDDGHGIRSVVFFKGCPLSCTWCHNPETQRSAPELSYNKDLCIDDGGCIALCPVGALDFNSDVFIDRELCTACGKCVGACPSGALKIIGEQASVEDILAEIESYLPFYRNSGGGITFSGGEPTHQMTHLGELAKAVKALGINTLLETAGHFQLDRYLELVDPWIDQVYFDLKLADDAEHHAFCGTGNKIIHANFVELARRSQIGGVPILARIPLIPDVTATDTNLAKIAQFLTDNAVTRLALLPYNPTWAGKAVSVGAPIRYSRDTLMSREDIEHCQSFFTDFELVQ